jgi:hypothetical protein
MKTLYCQIMDVDREGEIVSLNYKTSLTDTSSKIAYCRLERFTNFQHLFVDFPVLINIHDGERIWSEIKEGDKDYFPEQEIDWSKYTSLINSKIFKK